MIMKCNDSTKSNTRCNIKYDAEILYMKTIKWKNLTNLIYNFLINHVLFISANISAKQHKIFNKN